MQPASLPKCFISLPSRWMVTGGPIFLWVFFINTMNAKLYWGYTYWVFFLKKKSCHGSCCEQMWIHGWVNARLNKVQLTFILPWRNKTNGVEKGWTYWIKRTRKPIGFPLPFIFKKLTASFLSHFWHHEMLHGQGIDVKEASTLLTAGLLKKK